jgi:hypothetical protein
MLKAIGECSRERFWLWEKELDEDCRGGTLLPEMTGCPCPHSSSERDSAFSANFVEIFLEFR